MCINRTINQVWPTPLEITRYFDAVHQLNHIQTFNSHFNSQIINSKNISDGMGYIRANWNQVVKWLENCIPHQDNSYAWYSYIAINLT